MGMTICPICGDRVPEAAASVDAALQDRRDSGGPAPERDTAVLEAPPRSEPASAPPSIAETVVLQSVPVETSLRPSAPVPSPKAAIVDASVVLAAPSWATGAQVELPSPARPLNGPLILGSLAVATAVLLPATAALESHRMFAIMGFCLSGFLLPFPPIAWIAGLGAEQRRREQRLRVERRVLVGRLLGQWATLLLIAEGTFGLLFVAAMRLSGKFPESFWVR